MLSNLKMIVMASLAAVCHSVNFNECQMASDNEGRLLLMNKMLYTTQNILEKHNVPSWISQGTLLGSVRDNGTLPWTGDVDLHTFAGDITPLWNSSSRLSKDFYNNGLRVYGHSSNFLKICFANSSNARVFFKDYKHFAPESRLEIYGCVKRSDGLYVVPDTSCTNWNFSGLFPLKNYYVGNSVYAKGPSKPVYWLEQHFGKGWKTPVVYSGGKELDAICVGVV